MLIVGPPGAGKGTQAERIAALHNVPAISTGNIFRANIAAETELGLQVQSIIAAGGYVSDDITNALVKDRIAQEDATEGFLLDGYPRTAAQVDALDAMLAERGQQLDVVLELRVDEDELVRRMLARAQVEGRADDTEDVIRNRQHIYAAETEPLLKIFGDRDILVSVDGLGDIDDVTKRLNEALDAKLAAGQ